MRLLLLFGILCLSAVFVVIRAEEAAAASEGGAAAAAVDATLSAEQEEAVSKSQQTYEFQAEVHRLMDIIINSLYTNREIFVRELISNAADALDKIRFESLTNKSKLGEGPLTSLDIRIQVDKERKTFSIADKGVGMTREGLLKNLGVVAHSGTTEFLQKASSGQDTLSLIGQFGVGFYSVYLVADKVTVISKHNDDEQYVWQSNANKTFTLAKDPRGNTLGRGTQVILHLKPDASEFVNEDGIKRIIGKYSEFIQYPIYLLTHREEEREVPDEAAIAEEAKKTEEKKEGEEPKKEEQAQEAEKKEGEEGKEKEEVEVSEEEEKKDEAKPKTKKIRETVAAWDQVNSVKAIWTRNPDDVKEEEYDNFYKAISKDSQGMLTYTHFKAEGELSFRSILFLPKHAPEGYFDRFYDKSHALKLYVRKVLISEEFESDFVPRYLSFIKGVVDSDDLPLNVNREQLAQSRVLKVMGKKLTRKALEMIKKLADEGQKNKTEEAAKKEGEEDKEKEEKKDEPKESKYDTFWKAFGKAIKLGVIEDKANRVALAKLMRFQTSKSNGTLRSLQQYVADMKPKQQYIYFIAGASVDEVKHSPFLEKLVKRNLEVVFMVDPLDEYVNQQLSEFDNKKLMSVAKEGLKFGDEKKIEENVKKLEEEFKPLTTWLKETYGDKVDKVSVSHRISSSPCVIVTSQYGWSANMERIMKAQTFGNAEQHAWMRARKTMEINPHHPIMTELLKRTKEDAKDPTLVDAANLIFDSALLSSGFQMETPTEVSARIHRVIATSLKLDPNAQAEEPEDEADEEEEEEEAAADGEEAAAEDSEGSAAEETASAPAGSAEKTTPAEKNSEAKEDL